MASITNHVKISKSQNYPRFGRVAKKIGLSKMHLMHLCFRKSKSGQSALEYLSIVGIALTLLIPSTLLFLSYSKSTNDQVMSSQLNMIGNTIISKAEEMYIIGEGSWVTVKVNFPDSLRSAVINNGNEMAITYSNSKGNAQAVFFINRFNITNSTSQGSGTNPCSSTCTLDFKPGLNNIRLESNGKQVVIRTTN